MIMCLVPGKTLDWLILESKFVLKSRKKKHIALFSKLFLVERHAETHLWKRRRKFYNLSWNPLNQQP